MKTPASSNHSGNDSAHNKTAVILGISNGYRWTQQPQKDDLSRLKRTEVQITSQLLIQLGIYLQT